MSHGLRAVSLAVSTGTARQVEPAAMRPTSALLRERASTTWRSTLQNQTHIRQANSRDQAAVTDLAVINNMFAVEELGGLTDAFRGAVNGDLDGHQWFVATADNNDVVAAAYLAPEPFSDRLWNLYFIAVQPSQHGTGVGTALLGHLERLLRAKGEAEARVLIVETSSTGQYEATRAFYEARGLVREAQIREFYGPSDHKVVFWKALAD